MVRTASTMLPLGTECPDFDLDVVSGLELLPDDPLQGLKRIKRQDLIKPIQDRIFDAVQQLAASNKYSIIFDASSDLIMLYSNPDLDKSDKVLELMGY